MRFALAVVMVVVLHGVAFADGALVIVVDRAMSSDKIATVTHALTESLAKFDAADEIAIVSYAKTARVELALHSVTKRARVSTAVANIRSAATSDLNVGLRAAGDVLARTKRARKYVLVITDDETLIGFESALEKLTRHGVQVSALGFQTSNRPTLKALATESGRAFSIRRATDLPAAFTASAGPRVPATLAVVFAVDNNGAMRGNNLELAKELVRTTIELLEPTDTVAVVVFDRDATIYIPAQRASNKARMSARIAILESGVGTNYYTGLKAAFEIVSAQTATEKHVIVVGDGDAPLDGIAQLVTEMQQARVMVSAVGVPGADRTALSMIATAGDGRLYMIENLGALPRIFMREAER